MLPPLLTTTEQSCKSCKRNVKSKCPLPSKRETQKKPGRRVTLPQWVGIWVDTSKQLFWGEEKNPNRLFIQLWKQSVWFTINYLLNTLPLGETPALTHGCLFASIHFQFFWKFLLCSFLSLIPSQSLHSLWWAKDRCCCSNSHVLTEVLGQGGTDFSLLLPLLRY